MNKMRLEIKIMQLLNSQISSAQLLFIYSVATVQLAFRWLVKTFVNIENTFSHIAVDAPNVTQKFKRKQHTWIG